MTISDLVLAMTAAGAPAKAIAIAVEAIVEARAMGDRRREADRKRKRKSMLSSAEIPRKNEKTQQNQDSPPRKFRGSGGLAPARAPAFFMGEEIQESKKERKNNITPKASDSVAAREILLGCLRPEVADALLAHRRAKKAPLTAYAAKLLAKKFSTTADPNACVDTMIARGWTGYEAEWAQPKGNGNGSGRGRGSLLEAADQLIKHFEEEEARCKPGEDPFRLLSYLGGK